MWGTEEINSKKYLEIIAKKRGIPPKDLINDYVSIGLAIEKNLANGDKLVILKANGDKLFVPFEKVFSDDKPRERN